MPAKRHEIQTLSRLLKPPKPVVRSAPTVVDDDAEWFAANAPATDTPADGADESLRTDGTKKGKGFLGVLQRPDGKVSTEISVGVNIDGQEVEVPTLVPTLSPQERDWLVNNDVSDPKRIPPAIIDKAVAFARQRKQQGRPYFAQDGEQGGQGDAGNDEDWFAANAPVSAEPSLNDRIGSTIQDLRAGAAKGLGSSVNNLGRLFNSVTEPIGNAIGGAYAKQRFGTVADPVHQSKYFDAADRELETTNTTQRIGKGLEQIAETILPGDAIATQGTKFAAKVAPSLSRFFGLGKTAAQVIPRAAVEAAGGAGMAAVQGNDPVTGAAVGGVLGAAPGLLRSGARDVMQRAVKPKFGFWSKALKQGEEVPAIAQTLLDEGVGVTPKGLAKLRALLGETDDAIDQAVKGASGDVEPLRVASRLSSTARTFGKQVNPQDDLEAISQVGHNFLEAHPGPLSVAEAQALKRGTYARIGDKYGTARVASIEAEKGLARGLKEEVGSRVPAVGELNAREGKLIDALDAVGRRVAVTGNRDHLGITALASHPALFIASLAEKSPGFKSLIARGMYRAAAAEAKVDPQVLRAALASILEGNEGGSSRPPSLFDALRGSPVGGR